MEVRSGLKPIQALGCLFAALILYYAYVYKNAVLALIGAITLVYDGYLVAFEPTCVCKTSNTGEPTVPL
jgi:hypothetical protein